MSGLRKLLFGLVGAMLVAAPAVAELRYTTVYKDNRVAGSTPAALWEYMIRHPIIDPDDGPAFANVTHDHTLSMKLKTEAGACRVDDLTFTWKFVITLPKALDEAAMSGETAAMWREFTTYLKGHEEHHRQIFVDCGKAFVPAARNLTGLAGCFGMERKVRRYVDQQYDLCMKKQRAFDQAETARVMNLRLIKAAKQAGIRTPGF